MPVSIEWTTGIIRAGEHHNKTVEWKIGVDSDTENEVKGGGKV